MGATVGQGTAIARIATTEELQIRTAIPERFIAKIGLGQSAEIRLAAYPDHRFQARVTELSPVVDPRTRTMETVLGFIRPDSRIRAGMFAQIRLILDRKSDAVLLPVSAVVRRAGDTFVFVLDERDDETRAVRRDIRTGIQSGDRIEAIEGVTDSEYVVVQGQNLLEDRALVRIVAGRESRE